MRPCTVLYNTLNMCLAASIIGCQFRELIGCLSMIFSGASGSNVDNSSDGAYLGPFNGECEDDRISFTGYLRVGSHQTIANANTKKTFWGVNSHQTIANDKTIEVVSCLRIASDDTEYKSDFPF